MSYFNVRTYGILINEQREVLLSDEYEHGTRFTKFPGGGVELGEGIRDALMREYMEECGVKISILHHIYTTDVLVKSVFNDSQVIAVYYLITAGQEETQGIQTSTKAFNFEIPSADEQLVMNNASKKKVAMQSFRWVPAAELDSRHLSFEIDRLAWEAYLNQNQPL